MSEVHDELASIGNAVGHTVALGAIGAAILGFMPAVAAIVALIWYVIQIYESKTFQDFLARRRAVRLARLKRHVEALEKLQHDHRRSDT